MSDYLLKTTFFCLFSLLHLQIFSSVIPIELEERVEKSGQVIIAKVIDFQSYWGEENRNIYTSYTMEAMAYLKEESSAFTFEFILPGGEVDGEMEVVSPNIYLQIGQEYLILVEHANASSINPSSRGTAARIPHFKPHAHVQGVMPYIDGDYYDILETVPMDEEEMMHKIEKITKKTATTPDGSVYHPRKKNQDKDKDGICLALDCDDRNPNYPMPVGAACNDGNSATLNDKILEDGCTCAGNAGQPVNCENIQITVEGPIVRIDNLLAKRERIEIIGSDTEGLAQLICDGDCKETQYIEGLTIGKKIIRIWMYDADSTVCHNEYIVDITNFICTDSDNDRICDIKDCAPNNASLPAPPGTPCDDGNENTINDIILADGCSCAGITFCTDVVEEQRQSVISIKNGAGIANPSFITGTIAGDNDLVIEGSGFGSVAGTIHFPNSDSGGRTLVAIDQASDIITWTDNLIRVKVPSRVGSGTFLIKNSANATIGTGTINVDFAINSLYSSFRSFPERTRQDIKFTNRNGSGGFTLQLDTGTGFASSNAVAPLERAIDTWVCATGVHWQMDKSGTTAGFANDGNCVAVYEPNLPVGVLAITTSRYKASGNSSCSLENTLWYLKEFDIQFLPEAALGNFSWNYAPWPPQATQYDLETIALHELGHAHGLGHVIDEDEIMHFAVQSGVSRRTLSTHTYDAGQFKINQATQPICLTSHEPMTLIENTCEDELPAPRISTQVKILLEGFFNPTSQQLNTNLKDNNLLPVSDPFDTGQEVELTDFSLDLVDWALLELRDENDMHNVISQKPVLIQSDGKLLEVSGSDLITFEGLTDGNYYLAVFHKSHLPIISGSPQFLSANPDLYDFTASDSSTMGEDQQKLVDGKYCMISGDFDGNGIINSLDFNLWRQAGAAVNSYSPADADGNGIINNQDFNLWKANGSKISILQSNE